MSHGINITIPGKKCVVSHKIIVCFGAIHSGLPAGRGQGTRSRGPRPMLDKCYIPCLIASHAFVLALLISLGMREFRQQCGMDADEEEDATPRSHVDAPKVIDDEVTSRDEWQ
jgi:hypothetical protein